MIARESAKHRQINQTATLRGKAINALNQMTDEDRAEQMEKNGYDCSVEYVSDERKYFWVPQDTEADDLPTDEYYLDGTVGHDDSSGIICSDLLAMGSGTFDTILIDGDMGAKNVVSNIERVDGHQTQQLTVFSSGHLKAYFVDVTRYARLCVGVDGILGVC
jgi:hypothetical protein